MVTSTCINGMTKLKNPVLPAASPRSCSLPHSTSPPLQTSEQLHRLDKDRALPLPSLFWACLDSDLRSLLKKFSVDEEESEPRPSCPDSWCPAQWTVAGQSCAASMPLPQKGGSSVCIRSSRSLSTPKKASSSKTST